MKTFLRFMLGLFAVISISGLTYASSSVRIRYCDKLNPDFLTEGKLDNYIYSTDNPTLCYELSNTSDTVAEVEVSIVDAHPSGRLVVCDGPGDQFAKYVSNYEKSVRLEPGEKKRFYADLNFPPEVAGYRYGCVATVSKANMDAVRNNKGGVATIVRYAKSASMFVPGKDLETGLEVYPLDMEDSFSSNSHISLVSHDDGQYTLSVGLDNIGDLPQEVSIEGTVVDTFGNIIPLDTFSGNVMPKQKDVATMSFGDLPWYKLRYTVDLNLTHHAYSEFSNSDSINGEMLMSHTIPLTLTFFLFPRRLLYILIGLIVLIWIVVMIVKKSKKARRRQRELEQELAKLRHSEGK